MCNSFNILVEGMSDALGRCLGDVSIREVPLAMALLDLKRGIYWEMKRVEEDTDDPDYFGGFSFEDCPIFGGTVSKATATFPIWSQLIMLTMMTVGYQMI